MTRHELKCWPEFFDSVALGIKPFEVRFDDRGIDVGDVLHLREWQPDYYSIFGAGGLRPSGYTGRTFTVEVTYRLVLGDSPGWDDWGNPLPRGDGGEWVVLGIKQHFDDLDSTCQWCGVRIRFVDGGDGWCDPIFGHATCGHSPDRRHQPPQRPAAESVDS